MPVYRIKLYRGKFYAVWTNQHGETERASLRTTDREEAERRLVDMAELFAENARKIRARVPNASPQSKRVMQSEAHAWEQAATIAKDAVFAPQLPAGAVITSLSSAGADMPRHPANANTSFE